MLLTALGNPKLANAAENEARVRAAEFLRGLSHYRETLYVRDVEAPPAVLRIGAARLLDYGKPAVDAPAVVLVPSLINRYYILDLNAKLSFARYLRKAGYHVFIVDWGEPSQAELHFNCSLYVTEILVPMAEYVRLHAVKLAVGGYCMGGLLALALAQIRPDLADALMLLATPWDFDAPDFPRIALTAPELSAWQAYVDSAELMPAEAIYNLFQCINPYAYQNKLREFSTMKDGERAKEEFLAIEHWVQDGIPMTRGVAHDCLVDWAHRNTTARGKWRVGGQAVDPRRITTPCFVAAPSDDKIVPSGCALPLVELLADTTLIQPKTGHVGMIVGQHHKQSLWQPLCQWLDRQFT